MSLTDGFEQGQYRAPQGFISSAVGHRGTVLLITCRAGPCGLVPFHVCPASPLLPAAPAAITMVACQWLEASRGSCMHLESSMTRRARDNEISCPWVVNLPRPPAKDHLCAHQVHWAMQGPPELPVRGVAAPAPKGLHCPHDRLFFHLSAPVPRACGFAQDVVPTQVLTLSSGCPLPC